MAFANIWQWSETAASNTEIDGIALGENVMLPSQVNNALREMMSQVIAMEGKGSDVASAGTVTLGQERYYHITGTTTITDIDFTDAVDGRWAWLIFDGALTLTHNATTLKLPGGANITTAAGDRALFVQDATDNVICLSFVSAAGSLAGATLRLSSTTDASLSSTGHAFQVGPDSGANVVIDGNEIMARNNGATAVIVINNDGGNVALGDASSTISTPGTFSGALNGSVVATTIRSADDVSGTTILTTTTVEGLAYDSNGSLNVSRASGTALNLNRLTDDGSVLGIAQAGSVEGGISVSGTTVSISAATLAHWSQLEDHSRSDIPVGTILESIDKTCEWFGGYTEDGAFVELPPSYKTRLGEKVEYAGKTVTVIRQKKDYLAMGRICRTPKSRNVLGVFMSWDSDYPEGNDIVYAGGGTYKIRIAAGQKPQAGDYIQSDANGCGVVQDDDIIRASTVAKITAAAVLETYSDGSFLMPCFMVCG